jgi:hypothetical protein
MSNPNKSVFELHRQKMYFLDINSDNKKINCFYLSTGECCTCAYIERLCCKHDKYNEHRYHNRKQSINTNTVS